MEELSAAAAHKKVAEGKPVDVLDKFCEVSHHDLWVGGYHDLCGSHG